MANPASGAQALLAFAREVYFGQGRGANAYRYYRVGLPLNVQANRPENAAGSVNASGWKEPGLPGPVAIPASVLLPMRASDLLEPLENLLQGLTKANPETGAYTYTGTPNNAGVLTSLCGITALPPTANRERWLGGKVSQMVLNIGNNVPIMAALTMPFQHSTTLGEAVADVGNGGSYDGPEVRGVPAMNPANKLHVKVTQIPSGGGLQFEIETAPSSPTYPGAAVDGVYDADSLGDWQNAYGAIKITGTVSVTAGTAAVSGSGTAFTTELVVGQVLTIAGESIAILTITDDTNLTLAANHTAGASGAVAHRLNRDLGYWSENRDPVEIVFPGTTTAQNNIVANDVWTFPLQSQWADPTATYTADRRYTSSHLFVDYRAIGASTWLALRTATAQVTAAWAVTPEQGAGSKYPLALDREGEFSALVQLTRRLRDVTFQDFAREHKRFELRLRWLGQQIGTSGDLREGLSLTFPSVGLTGGAARPVANPASVIETLQLAAETNDAADAPVTAVVTTDRDYTVAT